MQRGHPLDSRLRGNDTDEAGLKPASPQSAKGRAEGRSLQRTPFRQITTFDTEELEE